MDLLARLAEGDLEEARMLVRASRRARCRRPSEPGPSQILEGIVDAGQRAGEFRSDTDSAAVAALLIDAYVGVLVRWLGDEGHSRFPLRDAVREICRIAIDGLRPRDRREEPRGDGI